MNPNFVYRSKCELCGSKRSENLISVSFLDPRVWDFLEKYYEKRIERSVVDGVNYEILKCRSCGFAWQASILNNTMMNKLYETWIDPQQSLNKKKYADIFLFESYAKEAKLIANLLDKKPYQIEVLDFGMGWGYWCVMAKAFGYNVKGFEISPARVEYAKGMGIAAIEDLQSLLDHRFDFISVQQALEHIPQPLETLKTLCNSLKTRGVVHISVPDATRDLRNLSRPNWKAVKGPLHPLEHINCFTPKTLRALGKAAGLNAIERPYPIVTRDRKETLANLIALLAGRHRTRGTAIYFKKVE